MNEQLEFTKEIASRLESAGIQYMLTGSMAMAIYMTPRMTRDIDLVIEVTSGDIERLITLFKDDCYIDERSVRMAVINYGMFNVIHNDWVVKADFIVRKNDNYRVTEFARRRKLDIEGVAISVVTVEDLILSKLVWGKGSQSVLQLRDVRQLIESVAEVDRKYLEKWAAVLGVEKQLREAMGR